jgi:hypothetical protein
MQCHSVSKIFLWPSSSHGIGPHTHDTFLTVTSSLRVQGLRGSTFGMTMIISWLSILLNLQGIKTTYYYYIWANYYRLGCYSVFI